MQCLDLDDAAGPALSGRRGVQPLQQRECLPWPVLRDEHANQYEIIRLPGVERLIVCAQAAVLCPPGRAADVAPSQQQPRALRRDGVEQADDVRSGREPLGLLDGVQGCGRVTLSVPDPGQRRQPRRQRLRVGELPAPGDAFGHVAEGDLEFALLVGHLSQAHVRDADNRESQPSRRRADVERLLVGPECSVQAALGALDLSEVMAAAELQIAVARRPPFGNGRRYRALGLFDPAAQPLG